jgi:hypothetical protein
VLPPQRAALSFHKRASITVSTSLAVSIGRTRRKTLMPRSLVGHRGRPTRNFVDCRSQTEMKPNRIGPTCHQQRGGEDATANPAPRSLARKSLSMLHNSNGTRPSVFDQCRSLVLQPMPKTFAETKPVALFFAGDEVAERTFRKARRYPAKSVRPPRFIRPNIVDSVGDCLAAIAPPEVPILGRAASILLLSDSSCRRKV